MDAKKVRKEIEDFRKKLVKFEEELKRIVVERNKLNKEDAEFTMLKWRFNKTTVKQVDEAWDKLTKAEKDNFLKENQNV